MPAYRDESGNKTWCCRFYYTNRKGEKLTKKKRGFSTKKEAIVNQKILSYMGDLMLNEISNVTIIQLLRVNLN